MILKYLGMDQNSNQFGSIIESKELEKITKELTNNELLDLLKDPDVNGQNKQGINQILSDRKNQEKQKSYTLTELEKYKNRDYFVFFEKDIFLFLDAIEEPHKTYFIKTIIEIIDGKADNIGKFSQLTGIIGEMESTIRRTNQGLKLSHERKDIQITYNSPSSKQEKTDKIQSDVPLEIENKAWIYETKNYPRFLYGAKESDYNQFEKYQAAIEQGKAIGVTFEIQGRISEKLSEYIRKFPEIEIIYTLPLPSGAKYQTIIHDSNNKNLKPYNDNIHFSDEDNKIINVIENNKSTFIKLLYEIPEGYTFDDIKNIKEIDAMVKFQNKWIKNIRNKITIL